MYSYSSPLGRASDPSGLIDKPVSPLVLNSAYSCVAIKLVAFAPKASTTATTITPKAVKYCDNVFFRNASMR